MNQTFFVVYQLELIVMENARRLFSFSLLDRVEVSSAVSFGIIVARVQDTYSFVRSLAVHVISEGRHRIRGIQHYHTFSFTAMRDVHEVHVGCLTANFQGDHLTLDTDPNALVPLELAGSSLHVTGVDPVCNMLNVNDCLYSVGDYQRVSTALLFLTRKVLCPWRYRSLGLSSMKASVLASTVDTFVSLIARESVQF